MRRAYIVTNTKKCILAAALVMTLSGCPARPDPLSAEYLVSVDADRLLNEKVSIFDIFSDVKVVSLDSRCPLSNTVYAGMSNLAFDGDFFYILDTKTSDICVFEEDGTLVIARGTGSGTGLLAFLAGVVIGLGVELGLGVTLLAAGRREVELLDQEGEQQVVHGKERDAQRDDEQPARLVVPCRMPNMNRSRKPPEKVRPTVMLSR